MRRSNIRLDDYAEDVGARLDMIAAIDGKQPGDPVKAAEIFVQLATMEKPPTQLVLGTGLYHSYREKLAGIDANLNEWEALSLSADYPQEQD